MAQAIAETIELAKACEKLGYHRYWLAEHHNTAGLAGTAPEVLLSRLGAETKEMRIGSGGVMLSHYSALKVAENFRVLEALYPGRVDLGIGRAPGSDRITDMALKAGPGSVGIENFPRQIADVIGYLREQMDPAHPFARVHANPSGVPFPEFWLLGSSDQSAAYAAMFGCAFSFAHFITDQGGPQVMAAYRQYFEPSPWLARPVGSIGVFAICAETEEEANTLAAPRDLWRLRRDRGEYTSVPTLEEALNYPYTPEERQHVEFNRRRQAIGTPEQVKARLLEFGAAYGVDEFVVVTICHDFRSRVRSYELIASAFGVTPR
jgi:luciferase family oxidoreductase group 1